MFDAIRLLAKHECVLVRSSSQLVTGIVTAADISAQFHILSEPFLLLGDIENSLRYLIEKSFSVDDLKAARERHCFFAYPEDHPVGSLVYDEERRLKRVIHRPAFEVAMTYRTAEGAIEVLAPGGKEQCAKIAAVLSAVVLEGDEVEDSFRPAVNLGMFHTRAVSMPTDPRDHIVAVNIAELGYRMESSRNGRLLTFRLVGTRHEPLDIYDLVECSCGEANPLLAQARVDRVVLRAVIKPPDAIRPRSVRFALQHPDRCTLGDRRHDQLLRKYLVQWGVLSVRPAKNAARTPPRRHRQ
jgi:hypothetical protein